MSDKKVKNDKRKVEWAFDFANIGESFSNVMESLRSEEELTISEFNVPKADVESAHVTVKFSVAQGFVQALEDGSDDLFKATIHHVGEVEFTDEGDTSKTIAVKQKGKFGFSANPLKQGLTAFSNRNDLKWDINLSPDVPLSLNIDGGIGPTKLDLSRLQLHNLKVDTGIGTLDMILPPQDKKIEADIDGGVGQTKIYVPDNADIILNIDGGVGEIEVTVSSNDAVQVMAEGGIGSVKVPDSLKRITKSDMLEKGKVWQSEGFDLAQRRISIRYDGGVGEFKMCHAEIV
ncbi:MAG: toast rack family protein [Anaerolineae bacterium]|nr:toast rack family protein [Anaerolineae bacterium]MDQ7035665.1 toast rack family protein [Anaerolineae bacterium]